MNVEPQEKPKGDRPATSSHMLARTLLERRFVSRKSLIAGLVGTILFHLIGIFWMPDDIFTTERGEILNRYRDFEIELEPFEEEEPEQSYTQTNPDAPENEPDEADTFAARSQQAAQEELPDEIDPENRPSSESEDDIETNQFITGDLSPPELSPPPAPQSQESEENEPSEPQPLITPITPTQPLAQQIPIPGEQEEKDPDETGLAEVDHDETEAPTNVNEYIEGEAEEGEEDAQEFAALRPAVNPQNSQQVTDPSQPTPRPRPRLPKVAPGPVRNHLPGVSRTGRIAVDAKFSEFGEYMERLIEAVSARWNSLANEATVDERRTKAVIKFVLDKNGYIRDMENMPGTTSKFLGIYMARTAVEDGAPYGPWTPEMVEVFGDDEEVTFSFHYN